MIDRTDPTNRDTVPAMLTPGEFVLNKEATNMFAPVIEQMNNAGLQQRAMENNAMVANMGGGVPPQGYNTGNEVQGYNIGNPVKGNNIQGMKSFLDFIGSGEGGYEASNRGTVDKKIVGSTRNTVYKGKKLSEMTVNEILAAQASTGDDKLFAVGKYQMIPSTFKEVVEGMGLSGDTVFSNDFQDQAGMYLATQKRPILGAYLNGEDWEGKPVTEDTALMELAKEWASAPLPYDVQIGDTLRKAGESRYGSGNKAQHSVQEARDAIRSAKISITGEYPEVPQNYAEYSPERFEYEAQTVNNPGAEYKTFVDASNTVDQSNPNISGVIPEVIQTTFLPNPPSEQPVPNQYRSVPTEPNQYRSVPNLTQAPPEPEQSFSQAFASGRAAHGGGGGVFNYNGQQYSTNIAEEEEQNRMMASQPTMTANMGGNVQHLNMGDLVNSVKSLFGGGSAPNDEELLSQSSQSIDQIARQRLQDDVDNSIFSRNERDALTRFDKGMLNVNRNAVPPPRQMGLSPGEMANQTTLESTVPPTVAVPPNGSALNNSLRKFFEPIGNVMNNNPLKDAIAAGNGDLEAQKRLEAAKQVVPQVNSPPALPPANYSLLDANQLSFLAGQGDDNAIEQELINERRRLNEQHEMSSSPLDQIDLTTPILAKVDLLEQTTFSAADIVKDTERELNRVKRIASTLGPNDFIIDDIASLELQLEKDREALDAARQAEEIGTSEADKTLISQNLVRPEVIAEKGLPATKILEPNRDTLTKTGSSRKTPAQIVADLELDNTEPKNLDVNEAPDPDPIEDTGKGIANSDPKAFSNAKSILKDIFGDLFDPKELTRAAIMYLGGRATGMNGNQALAFSGKQYIARTDAKANNFQTVAMQAVHTKESLSIYKKTMDPTDLILKTVAPISTGDFKQYYNRITGAPINAQKKKVGDEYFWFNGDKQMNMQEVTEDARMAKGTKENREYSTSVRKGFSDLVGELDSLNLSEGEGNKKGTPILKIAAKNTADAAYVFMQKNGVREEAMSDIIEQVYKEALVDQKAGQKIGSLEPYFRRAWVETQTQDAVNFQLPSGKPVAVDKIKNFLGTIRNVAKRRGNSELGARNDTQLSAFLIETPAYKFYNSSALSEEDRKRYIKDGNNAGISGLMQYMITELSKDTSS